MEKNSPWVLRISEDRMSAEMIVYPGYTGDETGIISAVRQAGIQYGLHEENFREALASRETSVNIAFGMPAKPGTDDRIVFHLAQGALTGDITPGLSKDLRLAYDIPSVQPGDLLAERIPGTPGEHGCDVYGKSIAAPRIRQYKMVALAGTTLSADGLQLTATAVGRPRLDISGLQYRFQVLPVYVHAKDLTLETAHLTFEGDIVIKGSITEGTSVQATGHVDVLGNVIGAIVRAGQSIRIHGNAIQSTVTAGHDWQQLTETLPLLESCLKAISGLTTILEQLEKQGKLAKLPFPVLVEKVIELQFPDLPGTIKQLEKQLAQIKKISVLSDTFDTAKILKSLTVKNWQGMSDLPGAASSLFEARNLLQTLVETTANIHCAYALNATLIASGKITVHGQGSFHSQLHAGHEVEINGIVRGGSIVTESVIKAGMVGSEAGALTKLQVGKQGRIEVQKAFENTIFLIGEGKMKLTDSIKNCNVILDRDGLVHLKPR